MREGIRMVVTLVVICMVAAASLAAVYVATHPRIGDQITDTLARSLKEVFPSAAKFRPLLEDTVWSALGQAGDRLGIVFKVFPRGYGGAIETMVGVGLDERITGIKTATPVEGLKETPGLGIKVNEPWFQDQFRGKSAEELILKKDNPTMGTIDGITAATVSTRAVAQGVKEGVGRYLEFLREPN